MKLVKKAGLISNPLGAGASVHSDVYDLLGTAGQGFDKIRAFVSTDQAGSLLMEHSEDAATWFATSTQAIAPNTPLTLESTCCARFCRATVTNGATPQTTLTFTSAVWG